MPKDNSNQKSPSEIKITTVSRLTLVLTVWLGLAISFAVAGSAFIVLLSRSKAQPRTAWQQVPGTDLQVRTDHPRILINNDLLPSIKCRAGISNPQACPNFGTTASLYNEYKDYIDSRLAADQNKPDSQIIRGFIHHYAFLYLLTNDENYCSVPIRRMRYDVANTTSFYQDQGPPARYYGVALAYDWCYGALAENDRLTIGNHIVDIMENYYNENHRHINAGYPWLVHSETLANPLSVIFEPGLTDPTNITVASLTEHYNVFKNTFVPSYNEVACDGAFDGYGGIRYDYFRIAAESFRTASTYIGMFDDSQFLQNAGSYWLQKLRSDLNYIKNPGKWNTSNTTLPGFFSLFASRTLSPYYQWMVEYLVEHGEYTSTDGLDLLLWYDTSIPKYPDGLESLSKVKFGTCDQVPPYRYGTGMSYMRSDWEFGSTGETVLAAFFNSPDLVESHSQNSFMITRGDDYLTGKSGLRTDDISLSYVNYYTRTISNDSISIYDPNQSFGNDPYHPGFDIANDGGEVDSDEDEGCARWPNACTFGYRGEVKHYETSPDEFAYIEADAAPAYHNDENPTGKTNLVERSFVYLPSNKFVVFDRAHASNPDFPKRFNLHMIEQPKLNGTITRVVEGNPSLGGVFESTNSDMVTIKSGNSALLSKTLLPENPTYRIIGGRNCHNEIFKESWLEPGDPFYDNHTHGDCTSYEQWIDGRNYTPNSRNDRPELFTESDRYNRNSTPGNETADWRVEIETTGEEFQNFLHVMEARDGDLALDNDLNHPDFELEGSWYDETICQDCYGGYHGTFFYKKNALPSHRARWAFTVTQPGEYETFIWMLKTTKLLETQARYTLTYPDGSSEGVINQNGWQGDWVSLGRFTLPAGQTVVELVGDGLGGDEYLMVDAVKLVYQDAPLEMTPVQRIDSDTMIGALVDSQTAVLFSQSGADITSATFTLNASGEVQVILTDLLTNTGYNLVVNDHTVTLSLGNQYQSTDDGVLSLTLSLSGEVNYPPVIQPIDDQEVTAGETLEFNVEATDQNPDDQLTLSVDPLPPGAVFTDHGNRTGTFRWTPTDEQVGIYDLVFTARDPGGLTDTEPVRITVTGSGINQPPVLDPIGDKQGMAGALLNFSVRASDADGDTLNITVQNNPSGSTLGPTTWDPLTERWVATLTWPNAVEGDYPGVLFRVTDGEGGEDTESITITILANEETTFQDHYTVDITENEFINQSAIENVIWDGNSAYFSPASGEVTPTQETIGVWHMNDSLSDGVASDASQYENHAFCTLGSTCPDLTTGQFQGGYQFDGVNDELAVASSASLNSLDRMTAALWAKIADNTQADQTLISFYANAADRAYLWFHDNTPSRGIRVANDINDANDNNLITGYTPTNEEWFHIAWVIDGSRWIVYINGEEEASVSQTLTLADLDDGFVMSFSQRAVEGGRPWNGTIDEVSLWNRALSPAEIRALMSSGPAEGGFESNQIQTNEYDELLAQWTTQEQKITTTVRNQEGVTLELSTNGIDWCPVENGGLVDHPNCPLPATNFKYRVHFSGPTKLDSVYFEWTETDGGAEYPGGKDTSLPYDILLGDE